MSTTPLILVNGTAAACIAAWDRGLQYGDGVFRTLAAQDGRVRWWPDHYAKLRADCHGLGLVCPPEAVLKAEVEQIAAVAATAAVKIVITRGIGERGYAVPERVEPTRIVMGSPARPRLDQPVEVRWCELRLSHQPRLAGIKHLNRLENILARSEWRDPAVAEGLLQDQAGRVICGTMSNLFIVESGALVTPDLTRCGVAGVTRERILRAARRHGVRVQVEDITGERLLSAEEVLLCNSLIGVWRVGRLGDKSWTDTGRVSQLRYWIDEAD